MLFYTIREAVDAIVGALDLSGDDDKTHAALGHTQALTDAVARNEIVYRDPVSRLPIRQEGMAAFMTAQWCAISAADLNSWLDRIGVGIRVSASAAEDAPSEDGASSDTRPTSAQLAEALGPYLGDDRDSEWLKKRLNDAARYTRLKKFRVTDGDRSGARWEVGGVVLYLIEGGFITRDNADSALSAHFPDHRYVLAGLSTQSSRVASNWFPG